LEVGLGVPGLRVLRLLAELQLGKAILPPVALIVRGAAKRGQDEDPDREDDQEEQQ
jgi:hypothetical protein